MSLNSCECKPVHIIGIEEKDPNAIGVHKLVVKKYKCRTVHLSDTNIDHQQY